MGRQSYSKPIPNSKKAKGTRHKVADQTMQDQSMNSAFSSMNKGKSKSKSRNKGGFIMFKKKGNGKGAANGPRRESQPSFDQFLEQH